MHNRSEHVCHDRRRRSFVVAVIAVLSALAVSVTGVLSATAAAPPAPGTFVVTGNVQNTLRLSVSDLAAMPNQQTVTVTFNAAGAPQTHTYTGPLLKDVLARATPLFSPAIKNDKLRHYVAVGASDKYQALVAYGEIDPSFENKRVLLAATEDGASLASQGPRLVVPGDLAGGRYVTGVVAVKIGKPGS